jgi:hypothetical protein
MSAYLDRSYYTGEESALAVCSVDAGSIPADGSVILVRDDKGRVLGRARGAAPETAVAFKIGQLPLGASTLNVELCDKQQRAVFAHKLALTRRAPKPGCEWKVDRVNRILLHDGQPFFPFGVLLAMWKPSEIKDDRYFAQAAGMGMNTVLQWCSRMDPADAQTFMQMAAKHNLAVMGWAAAYFQGQPMPAADGYLGPDAASHLRKLAKEADANRMKVHLMFDPILSKLPAETKIRIFDEYFEGNVARVRQAVDFMKDDPRLIGYKLFDEPPERRYFPMFEGCRRLSRELDRGDGYHPTLQLYSSYIPKGDEYVDFADCLGTDPYWVPGSRRKEIRGTVNFVARITALTDARAAERRQVTWIVPLAEFWVAGSKRPLVPEEQFCQTYLAIIHGAKGLLYFRHPVCSRVTVDAFTRLSKHMQLLGPIALTPDVPQHIQYRPGSFRPQSSDPAGYPEVQVSLRRNPQGEFVLLAANTRYYPVEATFGISLLGRAGTVRRLFGDDQYTVRDGAFSERLDGMATRAYVFDAPAKPPLPVTIAVQTKGHPEAVTPETAVPVAGQVGKKNLIPNPSFEESTLPGWPDYYTCSTPGVGLDYFLGDPDARFSLDPTCPVHGKYAVKMVSRSHGGTWTMCEVQPEAASPTPYVFSVYMKADRDGMEASFFAFNLRPLGGTPAPRVKLTRQWKRYWVTGTVPISTSDNPLWGVRTDDVGTMWADALQLEKGSEPTPFEP